KAFATHPQTPDRIEKSQQEIRNILPARPEYIVNTSEFNDVKARLAALENRKKMVPEKDNNKPSLRRTQTADNPQAGQRRPTAVKANQPIRGMIVRPCSVAMTITLPVPVSTELQLVIGLIRRPWAAGFLLRCQPPGMG